LILVKSIREEVPVKVGQKIELTIDGYGHEGEGVGRYRNFTIFIPEVLKGEFVLVKISEVKKNFARGIVLKILRPAPERIKPPCGIANDCGGCQLQHLNYGDQLKLKWQRVVDAVERIGGLKGVTIHPVLGMNDPWYYRNKVQYPLGIENVNVAMGFYRKGTHRIVPMEECLLQTKITTRIARKVKDLVEKYHVSIYDEQTNTGLLRHVLIKHGSQTGEVMVVFITNGDKFLSGEKIAHELVGLFPEIKSVVQNINESSGNVILGPHTKVLFGFDTITDRIGKFKFKIAAESFFQVNPVQTEVLYNKAVEYAELSGRETILDAYCGVGSLTLFLAEAAKKVYGIEVVTEAVKNATENAAYNEVRNVQFVVGTTERVLPQLVKGGITFQVGVVDPPRSGCEETVLKSLAENKVGRIVYVSCNPSTLARDLKVLDGLGYKTVEIQPVDMFPHTYHIECVARIERQ
jgi:23S rRNA (uracil1939-C5)-methyltransferase